LHQSLEEQEATVLSLRQAAEDARQALEAKKKQVEGELVFAYPPLVRSTCLGSAPNLCFSFVVFRLADCPGKLDNPGSGCADSLQLLATGVGRAVGRRPRGLLGSRGGRGASREFDGEPPPHSWWARHTTHAPRPSPGRPKGAWCGGLPPLGRPESHLYGLRCPHRRRRRGGDEPCERARRTCCQHPHRGLYGFLVP
jgi:hypothetical protein